MRAEHGRTIRARDNLIKLLGTDQIYAPVRGGDHAPVFYLGPLILARWDTDDWPDLQGRRTWHAVADCDGVARILGDWPDLMTVSPASLASFKTAIAEDEARQRGDEPINDIPPCKASDTIVFSYLDIFVRCVGTCLWTNRGMVGVRYHMLGHDQLLQIPYRFIEGVKQKISTKRLNKRRHKRTVRVGV